MLGGVGGILSLSIYLCTLKSLDLWSIFCFYVEKSGLSNLLPKKWWGETKT